ncbi:hypothetical protein TK0382 [Thermococcus kodakarensis KOD1]|uniref:Uncharacterized protein n=1 Tax=Thermococcus kodakarensis (strain ATCC BAA-918 / JCM 12380 / KOD1) TaxID=69014 RepID=Q5JCZ9_THEKO|nr:hypothetical protein [Thermococcus kodakarensis]WCN28451.1 hypothetical protein POG15_01945 [Thermococcus kodakarensis]WCN30747.1 hypothetical protein POG21_01945 [Thermococcus kodakarensis]BAD84571.1 hypothetical protein TK0382 [Thermococcus kodakarensis KOD1]
MSVWGWLLGFLLLGAILSILYDILFRPWKLVREGINDLERQLKLLDGRFARLRSFIIAPWLWGDVERTRTFVSHKLALKRAELELFEKLKGGGE